MNTARAFFATSLSVALVAACSDNTTSKNNQADASNVSDAPTNPGVDAEAEQDAQEGDAADSSPMPPSCTIGSCGSGKVCCFDTTGGTSTCTATGSCTGSVFTCSVPTDCTGGQVCCFTFTNGGTSGPFSTACKGQCPASDYQLCASMSDCPNNGNCMQGTYTTYCAVMPMMDAGRSDGSGSDATSDGPSVSDAPSDAPGG
jgi:hypothetical protein